MNLINSIDMYIILCVVTIISLIIYYYIKVEGISTI